jgi:hypothetical protein
MILYISFGQVHTHSVNGKTFDKDCLAGIECTDWHDGRKKAFEYFGDVFATSYEELTPELLQWFPRGVIPVNYES